MADDDQNLDTGTESVTAEAASQETATAAPETPTEKLLKQSDVNKIVGGAKLDAYEKGKRETLAEIERQKLAATQAEATTSQTLAGVPQTKEEFDKAVDERAAQRAQQAQAERVAEQFVGKMQQGIEKYQDFETVVTKLDIPNLPGQIIDWANSMDNTADIMYELGKNPGKFANVLTLSVTSPRLAYDEFNRLSSSIKQNQEAQKKNAGNVNEPLDQVKSSTNGTDSGKVTGVSALRKQAWLRG